MKKPIPVDLLHLILTLSPGDLAPYYEKVASILENVDCTLVDKPYWPDRYDGNTVFTLFPKLECPVCEGHHCENNDALVRHLFSCMISRGMLKNNADERLFTDCGLVPRAIARQLDEARAARDDAAVCIAPVLEHIAKPRLPSDLLPPIKKPMSARPSKSPPKDQPSTSTAMESAEEVKDETKEDGEDEGFSRAWVQTPLASDLATLLLAGMVPVRSGDNALHFPVKSNLTGHTRVIHLYLARNRFEARVGRRQAWSDADRVENAHNEGRLTFNASGEAFDLQVKDFLKTPSAKLSKVVNQLCVIDPKMRDEYLITLAEAQEQAKKCQRIKKSVKPIPSTRRRNPINDI